MTRMGFEPKIPVFKQAKIFHTSDRAATVIGNFLYYGLLILSQDYTGCSFLIISLCFPLNVVAAVGNLHSYELVIPSWFEMPYSVPTKSR
jgi:hypothetical protein